MRILIAAALLAGAALSHAQTTANAPASAAKKDLVAKVLQLQQAGFENLARSLAERPAAQMMQAAGAALQQVPADKREAAAKSIDADIRKYVEDAVPVLRERALKLAPTVYGSALEEKFSEDELRQLVAWLDSPVNRKFQQTMPELQQNFTQKLVADASPLLDPKIQALQARLRTTLGLPAPAAVAPAGSGPAGARPSAAPAARASAPAARPAAK